MNNKSKKIAAACLALAMVASVGAADVSGILPVVKPVTASAEGSDKLSDGEYYVNLSLYDNYDQTNTSSFKELPTYAKLKVENGKYFVTMTITTSYDILLLEKVKNDKYDTDAQSTPGFAKGLLPEDYDVNSSPFSKSLKRKIKDSYNDTFEKLEYTANGESKYDVTFEIDSENPNAYINCLYTYTNDAGKLKGSSFDYYVAFNTKNAYTIPDNIFTDFDKEVPINYDELWELGHISQGFKCTSAHAKAENGKLNVTYYYDEDEVKKRADNLYIGSVFKDENGNAVKLNDDNSFTVTYSTVDEILNGINYSADVSVFYMRNNDGVTEYIPNTSTKTVNLRINLADEPVTLTDPTTGVSVHTTTKYVSKNAALVSTDVAKDDAAYKTMVEHCENLYNDMLFKKYYIVDNGKIVTNTGRYTVMDFPVKDTQDKLGLSVYMATYMPEYDYWAWQICGVDTSYYMGYQLDNDTYRLITNDCDLSGYLGFFDKKSAAATADDLEDGTYEVPITVLNEVDQSQTSMASSCIGKKAKLVVKNGIKRIELEFSPVELQGMNGYLIQMWQEKNEGWKELTYTSYFKNEDGTYYTDDLNAGTNNYYPKTGYMELTSNAGQFRTKFRVSAMDYIMGNTGDATRNGIFTIYYDEAKKISDETPDPDPIEDPDFEPADMKALTDLVAKAEQYKEDDYTTSTFTTMKNALASAKTVLANSRATQEEVDSAVKELQTAIDALEEKKDVTFDINNLPDGKYQLYAQMIKTDRESFSMSNEGINHTVQLEVKDGEYYLTVQFKGLAIYNQFGYLQKLSYYDKGYTYNDYGIPQGTVIPAEVLTQYDIVDRYNDKDNLYPQLLKFKLVDKASEKYVPLQVFVPIMEAIADGTGTQDVLMQLDWTTLKATDADIVIEEPDAQSPVLDYTDSATGVKLHADKGVFAEGTTAVVKEVTSGDDYDNAKKLISAEADKFHLYDVSFKGEDGKDAQPNGKFTISLPIPSDYANPVVYRIADGKKTLISGTKADGMFTFSAKEAGQYLIEDKKSAGSNSDNKTADSKTTNTAGSANPSTGAAAKTGLLAAIGAAFAVATKKRKER